MAALAAFGASAAALGGVALWVAGAGGIMQVLTFRGATGWQIESVAGSVIHLTGSSAPRMESGSWRIGTIDRFTSIAMFAAAAPLCLWSTWRGARVNRIGAGWLAAVSALLLLSALFSPQFVIWLAPAGAIAWADEDRRLAALTVLVIVMTQIMWTSYGGVTHGDFRPMLLVVLRNATVLALAVSGVARLAASPDARPGRHASADAPGT